MSFVGSAASPDQFPRDGLPEVAFLGRSNVGKSSLLNALPGARGQARVSSTPGRTRLVNFFRVDRSLYLADLPGYGYARVPEVMRRGWERLVTSYLEARPPLRLCVFLVDARHDPSDADWRLRRYLETCSLPWVLVATKSDKLSRDAALRRRDQLRRELGAAARAVLLVSATTGAGVAELWGIIKDAAASRSRSSHAS